MSNFFNQEEFNRTTITEQPVTDFSYLKNQNLTLGQLEQKEVTPEIKHINIEELSKQTETEVHPVIDRAYRKQADRDKALIRARVKLYFSMFLLITLALTAFVVYNVVALVKLNNKVEKNNYKIKLKQDEQENVASISSIIQLPKDLNLDL